MYNTHIILLCCAVFMLYSIFNVSPYYFMYSNKYCFTFLETGQIVKLKPYERGNMHVRFDSSSPTAKITN